MTWLSLPWADLTVAVPLVGAAVVGRVADIGVAGRWCLGFSLATLGCAVLAGLAFAAGATGTGLFRVDELSAPLLPLVALLHVLTVLATARTKMNRVSFTGHLAGEAVRLATFATVEPWPLIALLSAATVLPFVELVKRGAPTRVYVLHMALFVGLLTAGWAGVEAGAAWGPVALMAAILVRSGTVPVHLWVADLFEHGSFGTALLFVAPIAGVYAALRLVLPVAPDWVLTGIGAFSLVTAVYAAGMAVVQRDARRFFAYLFLSHASLVLVGLELHTVISLTGALCLWVSVVLSLGGLGLTLRAVEARYGRLSLAGHQGLYARSPALAVCFLLTGLGSVGFPGTLGFVAAELLVDGAIHANLFVGVALVLAAAVNGIAVVRAYLLLFTGAKSASPVAVGITPKERFAVLVLAALVLGGGLVPQALVASRFHAAETLLRERNPR
ncbi:MAG: proton-conducting transporter membrane subunit [Gemmataceae bacterium]